MYIVFGAGGGIGNAVTKRIRRSEDDWMHLLYDHNDCDVNSRRQIADALTQSLNIAKDKGEVIRGIVFAVGVNELEWLGNMHSDGILDAEDLVNTNLFGFIRLMDCLADEAIVPRNVLDGLSVVAISSDAAVRPMRTSIAYCASKAGMNMAIRVAARELAVHGCRVLGVSPGMVSGTGMTYYIDEAVPRIRGWEPEDAIKYEQTQEVVKGRISPEDVAQVVHMALHGPKHWTGDIVTINGGR